MTWKIKTNWWLFFPSPWSCELYFYFTLFFFVRANQSIILVFTLIDLFCCQFNEKLSVSVFEICFSCEWCAVNINNKIKGRNFLNGFRIRLYLQCIWSFHCKSGQKKMKRSLLMTTQWFVWKAWKFLDAPKRIVFVYSITLPSVLPSLVKHRQRILFLCNILETLGLLSKNATGKGNELNFIAIVDRMSELF